MGCFVGGSVLEVDVRELGVVTVDELALFGGVFVATIVAIAPAATGVVFAPGKRETSDVSVARKQRTIRNKEIIFPLIMILAMAFRII